MVTLFQFFQMHVRVAVGQEFAKMFVSFFAGHGGRLLNVCLFFGGQIGNEDGGAAAPLLARRDALVGHDERSRLQDRVVFHQRTLQDDTLVADFDDIINAARFQHATGTNGHVVANVGIGGKARRFQSFHGRQLRRHDGALADAAVKANGDAAVGGIGPDDRLVPNRRLVPTRYIPDNGRRGRDERVVGGERRLALKAQDGSMARENLQKRKNSK
jgi:hypothetical protein